MTTSRGHSPIRILRIITRLNVGGPAQHCGWLFDLDQTQFDPSYHYQTKLLYGNVTVNEDEIDLAKEFAIPTHQLKKIPKLNRALGLSDLQIFGTIFWTIIKFRPHIIHTHTSKAGLLGRLAALCAACLAVPRARVIHTYHGHVFRHYFSRPIEMLVCGIERWLAANACDAIITISPRQQQEIVHQLHITPASKTFCLPLGINTDRLNSAHILHFKRQLKKELSLPSSANLVAIVSRIAPIKNHPLFIEIAHAYHKEFPNEQTFFLIVGSGSPAEMANLQQYAQHHQGHVLFLGNRSDLPRIYADLDVALLTSKNEGTPVSLLEAFSAQVPTIATAVGGIPDLFNCTTHSIPQDEQHSQRGILCQSIDEYVRTIHFILHHRQTPIIQRLISNAQNYVLQHHSKDHLMKSMDRLYQHLLGQSARR